MVILGIIKMLLDDRSHYILLPLTLTCLHFVEYNRILFFSVSEIKGIAKLILIKLLSFDTLHKL